MYTFQRKANRDGRFLAPYPGPQDIERATHKGDNRGWDDRIASPTLWTWVWISYRSWWWTGKPGMLQPMGSQRVGHNWATELNWIFRGGASGKEPACQSRRLKRHGFDPWVTKITWRRAWQPTPAFLPGESHGQRSLAGYSPSCHTESDMHT